MKAILLVAFCIAVAAALTAPPTPPMWPNSFSSSVLYSDNTGVRSFFRWFYDFNSLFERFDGLTQWHGDEFYAETIVDHSAQQETSIFYSLGEVSCFINAANKTMLNPVFSAFTYIGQALVGYEQCNWYFFNDTVTGNFVQLWSLADSSNEMKRLEVADNTGFTLRMSFVELDASPQDPSVFQVPALIQGVCNQESHISSKAKATISSKVRLF